MIAAAVGGILAGLLGVGGGIVIVPVLFCVFTFTRLDPDVAMPVAVATSLATIVATAISSARAHHKRGAVDVALILPISTTLAPRGAQLAHALDAKWVKRAFALFLAITSLRMLWTALG